jgi:hypothetical protein
LLRRKIQTNLIEDLRRSFRTFNRQLILEPTKSEVWIDGSRFFIRIYIFRDIHEFLRYIIEYPGLTGEWRG